MSGKKMMKNENKWIISMILNSNYRAARHDDSPEANTKTVAKLNTGGERVRENTRQRCKKLCLNIKSVLFDYNKIN